MKVDKTMMWNEVQQVHYKGALSDLPYILRPPAKLRAPKMKKRDSLVRSKFKINTEKNTGPNNSTLYNINT